MKPIPGLEKYLGLSAYNPYYTSLTLHSRCITGGRQKYRKKYYAFVEIQRPTGRCWCTLKHLLKSKADDKGQAQHEARKHFATYIPDNVGTGFARRLHVGYELIPIKHRQKKSQATTPDS